MQTTLSVWQAAQSGQDPDAREALMLEHLGLVQHVARQVIRATAVDAEFDDLVSAGTIGLIDAIEKFDPTRGLAFSTYAAPRIRGSVLDDLRRRDHVTRSIRRKQRDLSEVRERLAMELGRTPSEEEMAGRVGVDMETLWRWQQEVEHTASVSIERQADAESNGYVAEPRLVDEEAEDIEAVLNHREEVEHLRDAILELSEQERLVLSLCYFEEMRLHEIGTVLGVTESRVSQIRSKAISNLRKKLAHLRED